MNRQANKRFQTTVLNAMIERCGFIRAMFIKCKNRTSRKLKEKMRTILSILKKAKKYENTGKRLSEIDTQVILVEPILCIAGYDTYDPNIVKRASRNPQSLEFDIEIYKGNKLFLAIEVKALSSHEFNINSEDKIGALFKDNCKWKNKNGDGVGQLRAYCLNRHNKIEFTTKPILTNGLEWAIFYNDFLNEHKAEVPIDIKKDAKVYNVTDINIFFDLLKELKKHKTIA